MTTRTLLLTDQGENIGFADQLGPCRAAPQIGPGVFAPVRCDGSTDGNACFANRAGTRVVYPGECL